METPVHPVRILDMTTLRFTTAGAALRATTRSGAVLGVVYPRRGEDQSSMAFRAMDAALKSGKLIAVDPHDTGRRQHFSVALYNPFSGDIAYRATPDTLTFTTGEPLDVDPDGTIAEVRESPDGWMLHTGQLAVPALERDATATARIIASQAAA